MSSKDYELKFRSAYNNGYINGLKQGEAVELARILDLLDDKRADYENFALATALQPSEVEIWITKIEQLDALVSLIKENTNE